MNRNIELIRYRKFGDDLLMLDLLTAVTGTTTPTKLGTVGAAIARRSTPISLLPVARRQTAMRR